MAKVIVIGGGLAGLSSAVYLLSKGHTPHIIEKNQYLGGRTSSWVEDGMKVESGLHRVLGFYEEFPKLLKMCKINMDSVVEWLDEIEIKLPDGGPSAVFAISLKGKSTDSLLDVLGNNDFITPLEKLSLVKFFAVGLKMYFDEPEKLDQYSIYDFASEHGLTEKVIHRFIEPLSSGLFFLPPQEYSSFVFFGTIGPFVKRIHKIGEAAFKGGMTDVMCNPITQYIVSQGGTKSLGTEVKRLLIENGKVVGVETTAEKLAADHVILASDIGSAKKIIEQSFEDQEKFSNLMKLETMPAVTVQFELPKPIRSTDRVTFSPGTIWGSYAEQSRTTFKGKNGRLSLILSNPKEYIHKDPDEILQAVKRDAKRLNLDLSNFTKYKVVYLPQDFYALTPGSEKLRPQAETGISGLTLAGDYTKQKYLATMEGAVYSGRKAAEIVNKTLG